MCSKIFRVKRRYFFVRKGNKIPFFLKKIAFKISKNRLYITCFAVLKLRARKCPPSALIATHSSPAVAATKSAWPRSQTSLTPIPEYVNCPTSLCLLGSENFSFAPPKVPKGRKDHRIECVLALSSGPRRQRPHKQACFHMETCFDKQASHAHACFLRDQSRGARGIPP